MRTDSTPGHSRDTSGSPRALRQAGARNMSDEYETFCRIFETLLRGAGIFRLLLNMKEFHFLKNVISAGL